jgi:hypothetical protein
MTIGKQLIIASSWKGGEGMKASRMVICTLIISLCFLNSAWGRQKERPTKSPSLLDIPEKGLYYGFIVNNSSHFVEVLIWSAEEQKYVYKKIILPPPKSAIRNNKKALEYWERSAHKFRSPNVFSLWLKLGAYKVSIRNRDDIVGEELGGPAITFSVVLDEEYIERSPGPFTFEIEDDSRNRSNL